MSKEKIINSVYLILNSYRKNPYNEKFDGTNIIRKIEYFYENKLPITMIFPGFHGKINNPKFVLGPSLDMGDYVALKHIAGMCEKIREVYPHGVEFNIVHEGHFYVGKTPLITSSNNLDKYLLQFRKVISAYNFIKSYSIYELLLNHASLSEALEEFWHKYVPSDEALNEQIKQTSFLTLYQAYKKIHTIYYQDKSNFTKLTKSQKNNKIKAVAINQMKVYFGFGKLIKAFFKDKKYIRLSSLYKDPSFVDYLAINYLPNRHHRSTPSFNCLVEYKNGEYDYVRKYVAEERNFILKERDGLKYFKETAISK